MADTPTTKAGRRLRYQHVRQQTWDAGAPDAVNNFVTWCGGCGQRPWPCDTVLAVAAERERIAETVGGLERYEALSPLVYVVTPRGSAVRRAAVLAIIGEGETSPDWVEGGFGAGDTNE